MMKFFAEQEQQSDDSEVPRQVDYNAEVQAPCLGYSLLKHSGPAGSDRDYVPIMEMETAQLQELQTLNQEVPNLQGQMAEYRPGRPLIDVLRWGMPEFRVQFFHINSALCKERHYIHVAENLLRHLLDGRRNRQSRPDYRRLQPSRTIGQTGLESC